MVLLVAPEPEQLFVQVVAHDLVQRAEGFVHQQDIGIEGQRAGDAGALLHPARKLPGKLSSEAFRSTSCSTRSMRARISARKPHDLERQPDVALDGAPRIEPRRLEHIAIGAGAARLVRGHAVDRQLPPVGSSSAAMQRRKVVLPQPDGPMKLTKSPFSTSRLTSCRAWTGRHSSRRSGRGSGPRSPWPSPGS